MITLPIRVMLVLCLGSLASGRVVAETFRIPSPEPGLSLLLWHQAPARGETARSPVLFVHGATFPSANAAGWRIEGRSWMDELSGAGFDVWALDFLGYGGSDRYPEMASNDQHGLPLGTVSQMARQMEAAVRFIRVRTGKARCSIVAHSAGTFVAGRFAQQHPESLDRLVFFGAPTPEGAPDPEQRPSVAFFEMSGSAQWDAFEPEVREGGLLDREMFETWARAYLESDPSSSTRIPASVRVPSGMNEAFSEMRRTGRLPYEPRDIRCPALVIVGSFDAVSPEAQGLWLFHRLASPLKRFVEIGQGGHRMHLEASREQLHREVTEFLEGGDEMTIARPSQKAGLRRSLSVERSDP